MQPAVAVRRASVVYPAADAPVHALSEVSLDIAPGEFVSVVGPTGCGKSTLLNVAAGLLEPSSGTVRVFGEPLAGINRRAGYMFQTEALMPWRSALANVTAGLEFRGEDPESARRKGEAWLERVGLAGFGDRYPHQLSGGMRKRVSLAQMLILDPQILLMDEPFAALDAQTREHMQEELLRIWSAAQKTVLFITHQIDEAIFLSDRVIVFSARPGRVRDEIAVDMERPRSLKLKRDARFHALEDRIWGLIHEPLSPSVSP